jgi:serine/threonine protein kinase
MLEKWMLEPLFGRMITEVIAAQGPLPIAHVTNIGPCLLDVLQTAHRVGILHCDVKGPKVHLCDDGRVVLTDFGIACSLVDEPSNPTQMLAASPVYTAPERLRGGKPEPASALSSLGATLFAAVEGKPPFNGTSLFDTFVGVVEGDPAPFLHAGRSDLSSKACSPITPQTGLLGSKRAPPCWTSSTNISCVRDCGRVCRSSHEPHRIAAVSAAGRLGDPDSSGSCLDLGKSTTRSSRQGSPPNCHGGCSVDCGGRGRGLG